MSTGLYLILVAAVLYGLYRIAIIWGTWAILRSYRRPPSRVRVQFGYDKPEDFGLAYEALKVPVAPGIVLAGWLFRTTVPRRGVMVHLHGIWDSCRPRLPLAARMVPHGFDCVFYDSRGNGESGGRYCTYGQEEKHDLIKVLDFVQNLGIDTSRVAIVGHSMGAATAVYAAEIEPRIKALVLEACYRDLPTAIRDFARVFVFFAPEFIIRKAERRASRIGRFDPASLSPLRAMPNLHQPTLFVQGTADRRIKPHYVDELFAVKPEPKELYLIDGARHGRLPFEGGDAYAARLDAWICAHMPVLSPTDRAH
jgi:hypothetical protein